MSFYNNIPITINTLWYSLLWLGLMIAGGSCYEQRFIVKKFHKKLPTLEMVGIIIIVAAMLGFLHGLLAFFNLILPL